MSALQPTDSSLFFSRHDSTDPRLGEKALGQGRDVALIGYPDEEGIRLNGGREGAKSGPTEIRRWLYKMTPHPQRRLKDFRDEGDLKIAGELGARHDSAVAQVFPWLKDGRQVLSLGGGNDYAYADGAAFLRAFAKRKPLIINVDAHFDVRPSAKNFNSGTPFYRLLEQEIDFDFVEFGIQPQCNARAHWDYVKKKVGHIISVEDQLASGKSWLTHSKQRLKTLAKKSRPTFLAIDIDAFALPFAPGASSSWPLGLTPHEFWPVFQFWLKQLDVRVLGIYETSPPLDASDATAKWAAQLAHGFLHV
jgi:formiminoglutamase